MTKTIEADVFSVISKELKFDISKKEADKSQLNYRWDSLQHIKIIIAIEKKFLIKISTSDIGKLTDAKLIINYLKKKIR